MNYHIHLYNAATNNSLHKNVKTLEKLYQELASCYKFFSRNTLPNRFHKVKVHANTSDGYCVTIVNIRDSKLISEQRLLNIIHVLREIK